MDRIQAQERIQTAMEILRVRGWTTEQRERLIEGLYRDDAVEVAEKYAQAHSEQ